MSNRSGGTAGRARRFSLLDGPAVCVLRGRTRRSSAEWAVRQVPVQRQVRRFPAQRQRGSFRVHCGCNGLDFDRWRDSLHRDRRRNGFYLNRRCDGLPRDRRCNGFDVDRRTASRACSRRCDGLHLGRRNRLRLAGGGACNSCRCARLSRRGAPSSCTGPTTDGVLDGGSGRSAARRCSRSSRPEATGFSPCASASASDASSS